MTKYCRLCAELKESHEIVASIGDIEQSMEQKLRACCCWTTENTEELRLPHSVCAICLDRLDKCWLFSQSVQLAQQRLFKIFDEHTVDAPVSAMKIENETETETETEVVEIETKPLATEMEQTANDYPGYSNELPSPQIDSDPVPRPKAKKKSKAKKKREYQYPLCGKYVQKLQSLTKHVQRHSNDRPFECWLCHKTFPSKFELNQHEVIHVLSPKARREIQMKRKQEKPKSKPKKSKTNTSYKCVKCGKIFAFKSTMKEHLDSKHSNIYSFECWLCHRLFKLRRLLRSHLRVHMQQRVTTKENICELCGKTFTQRNNLNEHLLCAHADQRPFKCDICGLGFKLKSILKKHQITHMELQHKCTQCEKSFRKKSSLTKHMEYHTGSIAKPFVCDCCGKGFRIAVNLMEHQRIHTGEKPYSCEHCASNFRTMSSFYSHLRKTHGISKSARNREEQMRATIMSSSMDDTPAM